MITKKEFSVTNPLHNRASLIDVRWNTTTPTQQPLIVFIHGFKGFKDWGPFNQMADAFASKGFVFAKMNLSHNGTTPEAPVDFADLEAFGNNNFTIELSDITVCLDHLISHQSEFNSFDINQVYLIGHSRGGGLTILQAYEDARVKKIATWASVSSFYKLLKADDLQEWEEKGVRYIWNGRTKQQMPQYFQLYQDLVLNKDRFDILQASKQLEKPFLIVHGTADETVPKEAGEELVAQNSNHTLQLIQGAGHTFDGKHPFQETSLPTHLQDVVNVTISFFTS